MICTIYSHHLCLDKITSALQQFYPKGILTVEKEDEFTITNVEIKGGLFSSSKKIKISYRQRNQPSYSLPAVDDSSLTTNLKGLYGFVSSIPSSNQKIKDLFLQKIQTLNCEFSIIQEQSETKELGVFIENLAEELDAILFVQPNTIISKSPMQHFLDKNLNLIIDPHGNCEIENLDVKIDSIYFDNPQTHLTDEQVTRKTNSEKILEVNDIKINRNLPCIESEDETTIRESKEIARRVTILAITNFVAFNSMPADNAIEYLKKHKLLDFVTPKEKEFLANPTNEKKINETWKCEDIWTLMWALNKVDDLGFPNEVSNLTNIPADVYPVAGNNDPNDFINSINTTRTKKEILDTNDLYYRIHWACVDARINGRQINEVHPSVVYERHYALNWLINYGDQSWDDVSCDT